MKETAFFAVVVIGGGPSGFGAAMGAALQGVSVALVERHPVLGGMGTAGLVNNFCEAHYDGERFVIGGVFGKLRQSLIERGALYVGDCMEPFDMVAYAEEMKKMCLDAGVEIFLGEGVASFHVEDGAAEFELSDGKKLQAGAVVDATGDAVIAAASGVPFRFGRPQDESVMPLTLCYMIGPIDLEKVFAFQPDSRKTDVNTGKPFLRLSGLEQEVAVARERGELTIRRDHVSCVASVPGRPEYATVNFGRVFVKNPTEADQLAEGERIGRTQVDEGIAFFRKYVPGFEKVELAEVARQVGVRQSRQIEGLYTLTARDVLECRQFEDVIAQCHYPIDIHEPDSDKTTLTGLPGGCHYDIPLRCLIPASGPANLIVGGRAISATHEAMSSFRVSPSAMAIGEAAGTNAALSVAGKCGVSQVEAAAVQEALRKNGGILS